MEVKEIVSILNNKFLDNGFIFEKTDDEKNIVGFVNDGTFKNIISVIEPTESEMNNVIKHIETHINDEK